MKSLIIGIVLTASALIAQIGNYGSIQGTVTASATPITIGLPIAETSTIGSQPITPISSPPVGGATVVAAKTAPPLSRFAAATAKDGTFTLIGLPPGQYALCVQPPGDGYIGSCDWNGSPVTLTVTAGKISSGHTLGLTLGSVVPIVMSDPNQLIMAPTAKGNLPHLEIGVVGGPRPAFHLAHRVSQNANGSTYQVTVPFSTNIQLSVQSKDLQIADSAGKALPSAVPFLSSSQQATGSSPLSFQFSVVGLKP